MESGDVAKPICHISHPKAPFEYGRQKRYKFPILFENALWCTSVAQLPAEIESTLPGFKDQYVPKMMTLEILEEVIPFVKEFTSKIVKT